MKLFLVKHGRTKENEAGITQGHLPGILSDFGLKQANELAEKLKDIQFDIIFTSDLKRSADTAEIIAKFHPGIRVVLDKRLREFDWGNITGKKRTEIDWDNFVFRGESPEQAITRAKEFLNYVYETRPDDTVLFVSHSYITKAYLAALFDRTFSEEKVLKGMKETDCYSYEFHKEGDRFIVTKADPKFDDLLR